MSTQRLLAGRYRLEREIGRGAMGVVWEAHDDVLRRRVAIKEVHLPSGIPPHEAEQLSDRTLREARAIAALSHPHVITLFDILPLESGPAIVMELLRARSLAEILAADGPLDPIRAAHLGAAVALGLQAAHAAGITHRDVKPANVLIGDDGRIKLTDFGIARSTDEQSLTATGMLLGSPAYISPEVAAGNPATAAADIWGLGALLFAAVEGKPPFDRGNAIATLTAVVSDPLPDHPHAGPVGAVIDGLLVKEPAGRMSLGEAARILSAIAGLPTSGGQTLTIFGSSEQTQHLPTGAPTTGPSQDQHRRATGAPLGGGVDAATPEDARSDPHRQGQSAGYPPALPAAQQLADYLPAPPPPPWAAEAVGTLPPLPTEAAEPRRRLPVAVAAIAMGIVAAAVGFGLVLGLAHLAG